MGGHTDSEHEYWPFVNLGMFPLSAKYLKKLLELEPHN